MRIKQLLLLNFGPFPKYKISFVDEDQVCVLLTGKNNEGKSSIINGLKLLNAATRVLNKKRQLVNVERGSYYKLLQQDTEDIIVGRMIYNYADVTAKITGIFEDNFQIDVYLNPNEQLIYADYEGFIPPDVNNIFGFIPPLGPLSEREDLIYKMSYLLKSIETSLAPRHLRNHLAQILTPEEFDLVRDLVNRSWRDIELLNCEINKMEEKIYCYYRENRIEREISWAGQGLQVWFQIVTHLVRLRNASILILDEPEINLHPEKQNELIKILKDYYRGSILIATHSVELMNNVSVSHIVNVQKNQNQPKIKSTKDRPYLEMVRSQIGSNFNLIASQFEDFDHIIFTENVFDFDILQQLSAKLGMGKSAFNIPIYGFSEYRKCISYKNAYKLLIGKKIKYTLVLDKDYYPEEYLTKIKDSLYQSGIRVCFTPGKEIENIFLSPDVLSKLIPDPCKKNFSLAWDKVFDSLKLDCFSTYISFHTQFLDKKLDAKSITKKYMPVFEKAWNNKQTRHEIIDGKKALKALKDFFRSELKQNLNQNLLIDTLSQCVAQKVKKFFEEAYQLRN
jgi:predicted ATPase